MIKHDSRARIAPGGSTGANLWAGDAAVQFILVLHGAVRVTVDCGEHALTAGDAIRFPGTSPCAASHVGDRETELISATTPAAT